MADKKPERKRMEDPHVETKSKKGKRLPAREKNPDSERREEIRANGSEWVVVTEVRIKYEVRERDGVHTYEVYLDPGKINSIHFDQIDCDAAREALHVDSDHVQLAPDGSNEAWNRLIAGDTPFATLPRRTPIAGLYRSSHGPLCVHEDDCTWYCVCGDLGLGLNT